MTSREAVFLLRVMQRMAWLIRARMAWLVRAKNGRTQIQNHVRYQVWLLLLMCTRCDSWVWVKAYKVPELFLFPGSIDCHVSYVSRLSGILSIWGQDMVYLGWQQHVAFSNFLTEAGLKGLLSCSPCKHFFLQQSVRLWNLSFQRETAAVCPLLCILPWWDSVKIKTLRAAGSETLKPSVSLEKQMKCRAPPPTQ